MLLFTNCF